MSETRPRSGEFPGEADTARSRSVIARGVRVPWPRRLISAGLLAAVAALALHALPRPYQPLSTRLVRRLGDAYGGLRSVYKGEVAALEPLPGEAAAPERSAYARELWRHRWFGTFREILLRFLEWTAASCMAIALTLVGVERRRTRRALAASGARTEPALLRRETLDGDPLPTDAGPARPAAGPMPPAPRGESGEEVTPPHPTPIPGPARSFELRPAVIPPGDDDDLARETEDQTPNLADRPVAPSPPRAARAPGPTPLPVFFVTRRVPDDHPVVRPGDAAPLAEPPPAAPGVGSATPGPTAPGGARAANDNPGWWPKPER